MTTTSVLIPVLDNVLGYHSKPGVNARKLYEFLELNPVHWARWIKRNIQTNPYAIEHEDWETFHPSGENRTDTKGAGRPTQEYVLSIDLAKKLAMMTRSDKGEEARRYFLDCERIAQGKRATPQVRDPAIQMLIDMAVQLDEARTLASEAKAIAQQALDTQQWLTIREYVFLNTLDRQMPPSYQQEYGKYLTGHCLENGIPMRKQPIADRPYTAEHAYHVGTIEKTLPGWLLRRSGQPLLTILPGTDADGNSTLREARVPYLPQRKRTRGRADKRSMP